MRLNEDSTKRREVAALLLDQYDTRMTDGQVRVLMSALGTYEAEVVAEAVERHMSDTTRGSDGLPAGRWPPTLADIRAHLQAAQVSYQQKRQEQERKQREQESDKHYSKMLKHPAWRAELERAAQLKRYVAYHLSLDLMRPQHRLIVRDVLEGVRDEDGLLAHADNATALSIAEQRMEHYAKQEEQVHVNTK